MSEREDELIQQVARELQRPVAIDPALDTRVMAAVEAVARAEGVPARLAPAASPPARRRSRVSAAWDWLRRPRAIPVSPLGALAAAGVLALGFGIRDSGFDTGPRTEPSATVEAARPANPESRIPHPAPVQFVLVAPGASAVAVVGDFNDWDSTATRLRPAAAGGVWSVTVPLAPGRHRYAFIVDGREWRPDPTAPRTGDDDFGVPSSVVTVGERST